MEVIRSISSFIDRRTRAAETPFAAMRKFHATVDQYNIAIAEDLVAAEMAPKLDGDKKVARLIADKRLDVEVLSEQVLEGPSLRRVFVLYESPRLSLTIPLPKTRRHKSPDPEELQEELVTSVSEEYDTY